jgi:hypothetical protein
MRLELTIFVSLSKMFETVSAFHCHMMFLSLYFDEHVSGHAMEEKTRERAGQTDSFHMYFVVGTSFLSYACVHIVLQRASCMLLITIVKHHGLLDSTHFIISINKYDFLKVRTSIALRLLNTWQHWIIVFGVVDNAVLLYFVCFIWMRRIKWTHREQGNISLVFSHVSLTKILNGFRLNLVLDNI